MVALALPLLLTWYQTDPASPQLEGADKIVASLGSPTVTTATAAKAKSLFVRLKTFGETCENLPPNEAADRWVSLLEETQQHWEQDKSAVRPPEVDDAMEVLPPPQAWPAIRRVIEEGTLGHRDSKSIGLRLFGELLNNDLVAAQVSLERLKTSAPPQPNVVSPLYWASGMEGALAKESGDHARILRYAEQVVAAKTEHEATDIDWDDLPELVGETKARELFEKLLLTASETLDRLNSPTSRRIVLALALRHAPQLDKPLWSLAGGLDTAALYPVFAKLWPAQPENGDDFDQTEKGRGTAKLAYALSLELAGKHDLAVSQSNDADWPSGVFSWFNLGTWRQPGVAHAYYRLMSGVAAKSPDKVQWDTFIEAAEASGHGAEAARLIARWLPQASRTREESWLLVETVLKALMATDQIKAALLFIEQETKREQAIGPVAYLGHLQNALLAIGSQTDRPDLVEKAIGGLLPNMGGRIWLPGDDVVSQEEFIGLCLRSGHGQEAENQIVGAIAGDYKRAIAIPGSYGYGSWPGLATDYAGHLVDLANLYWHANRPKDVLKLFLQSPGWGVEDIATIYFGLADRNQQVKGPVPGFYAAWALEKTGHKATAAKVILPCLHLVPDFDPAYQVLLDAKGAAAIPAFDRLFQTQPNIARPLVWKAVALHQAHREAEAEAAIRKAIAVDPSDENADSGRWQSAYAVLAEIRAARGDHAGAAKFLRKVEAAKLAERGGALVRANLNTRAISIYEQAAKLWPDSAFIQLRLGEQLEQFGRASEAARHLGTGFNLLPDQLGAREGPRFDFDHLFVHEIAARTAESTFTERLRRSPNDAKTHYLLGRLADQLDRDAEASKQFAAAAKLAPAYVPALIWVTKESREFQTNASIQDRAWQTLKGIDPNGLFGRVFEGHGTSPVELWNTTLAATRRAYSMPSNLWRLMASAQVNRPPADNDRLRNYPLFARFGCWVNPQTAAAEEVTSSGLISAVVRHLLEDQP